MIKFKVIVKEMATKSIVSWQAVASASIGKNCVKPSTRNMSGPLIYLFRSQHIDSKRSQHSI